LECTATVAQKPLLLHSPAKALADASSLKVLTLAPPVLGDAAERKDLCRLKVTDQIIEVS
jgi:hypothetical protein